MLWYTDSGLRLPVVESPPLPLLLNSCVILVNLLHLSVLFIFFICTRGLWYGSISYYNYFPLNCHLYEDEGFYFAQDCLLRVSAQ